MQPMRLYTYNAMPVRAREREVLVRLGMGTKGDEADFEMARQALKPLMPGGCMRLVPASTENDRAYLAGKEIVSRSLAKNLSGCEFALVMLSTLGKKASEEIQAAFLQDRADEAVVWDAAASAAADAGLDFLMRDAARMLRPLGKVVRKNRFSPGYADCGIENQKVLLRILHDQPFGVTLTDGFMLLPEKTVLAIGGVTHA